MQITIHLPREIALTIAQQRLEVTVLGPIHDVCYGSITTMTGTEVLSIALPGVEQSDFRAHLIAFIEQSRTFISSDRWDGHGLTAWFSTDTKQRICTVAEALGIRFEYA